MATLSRATLQKLAVLRALSLWKKKGAYGPLRLQKILFYADKGNDPTRRLFTFKKWRLGQYSDEVSESLNDLRRAGRMVGGFEGPAERLVPVLSPDAKRTVENLFSRHFREWTGALKVAFMELAFLSNDAIIEKAHDDATYKHTEYGQEIFKHTLPEFVDLPHLHEDTAEMLADLVDTRLRKELVTRFKSALERPVEYEDWRAIYFGEEAAKAS